MAGSAPQLLKPIPGYFPQELISRRQWLYTIPEYDPKIGRWAKPPYSPLKRIKWDKRDPAGYGTVYQAIEAMRETGGQALGLAVTPEDDLVLGDIDKCVDAAGAISPAAREIVEQLPTYWELSPSGRGLRFWALGKKPEGAGSIWYVNGLKVEVYDAGAWGTVTGHCLRGTAHDLRDCTAQLAELYTRRERHDPPAQATSPRLPAPSSSDAEILEKIEHSANPATRRLMAGDVDGYGSDHSRADLALCRHLAYWTGSDPDQIDRLFRRSGLMRDKWDKPDGTCGTYGARTIGRALQGATPPVFSSRRMPCGIARKDVTRETEDDEV